MQPLRLNITPRLVPGQRIAAVDELKGVAIVLILLYHCGGVLGAQNIIHGEIGVDIFLVLSGFTLAAYSADIPLRQFFLRRFLRIYPAYWMALGLFIWMHHHYLRVDRPWESIWHHILGIHGFTRPAYFTDFVDAFWFISMIVGAYLVFACIRRRLDDFSLIMAVTGILTVVATVAYQYYGNVSGLISLAVRVPSFFAGVVAGRLLSSGTMEIKFNLSLGVGLLCFYYQTFFRGVICNYTIPALGIILCWIGLRRYILKVPAGKVALGAVAMIGLISYEVYLFHQPLVRDYNLYVYHITLHNLAPTRGQILAGILIALGVTLVIAVAVHYITGKLYSIKDRRSRLEVLPPFSLAAK
jgi:peptidoglycan/LPS O-acetylase OafA/YrhL